MCARSLNCALRFLVASGCRCIEGDRGWLEPAAFIGHIGSGDLLAAHAGVLQEPAKVSVICYGQLVIPIIPINAVRIGHSGLSTAEGTDRGFQTDGLAPVDHDRALKV